MNIRMFVGACILAGALMLKFGAPLPSVLAGVILSGLWTWKASGASRLKRYWIPVRGAWMSRRDEPTP